AGDVVFTGRVPHDEVHAYYGQIDLFVVARRDEETSEVVTPLKPFEAMAVERAVIVADLTALREIVRDGETGRTFRPEDTTHLADVAQALIDDPAERARLAAAGREWVAAERTWGANAARYRELYAELGALGTPAGSPVSAGGRPANRSLNRPSPARASRSSRGS